LPRAKRRVPGSKSICPNQVDIAVHRRRADSTRPLPFATDSQSNGRTIRPVSARNEALAAHDATHATSDVVAQSTTPRRNDQPLATRAQSPRRDAFAVGNAAARFVDRDRSARNFARNFSGAREHFSVDGRHGERARTELSAMRFEFGGHLEKSGE